MSLGREDIDFMQRFLEQIKPEASRKIPHACPVCNGYKTVSKPPNICGDQVMWSGSDASFSPCPACNATGIIWETK